MKPKKYFSPMRWLVACDKGGRLLSAALTSLTLLWGQTLIRSRTYGGSLADVLVKAFQDANGYVLVGYTRSKDGLLRRNGYDADFWVLRVDRQGEVVWHATYGAEGDEELTDAYRLQNGSLLLVGWTDSKSLSHGKRDAYIVYIDPLGKVLWQKAIGGTGNDVARGVRLIGDSVIAIAGEIGSIDSLLCPKHRGGTDGWLLLLSLRGELLSSYNWGGSHNDYLRLIVPVSPDTLWLIGASDSHDGEIANPLGKMDIWIVETDGMGRFQRSWNIGGTDFEEPYTWTRAPEGEIWVGGTTFSRALIAYGRADGVVWKIEPEGSAQVVWQGGGTGDEGLNFLSRLPDGDWLLAGMTSSRDGLIPHLVGLYDGWAVRWNPYSDSLRFSITLGGKDIDRWEAAFEAEGGTYVSWGTTASKGDEIGGIRTYGSADFWGVWWKPDTLPPPPILPEGPTWLLGYVHLSGTRETPIQLFFRSATGQTIDSLTLQKPGFFRWQVPDTILSTLRVSCHAQGYLWKEIAVRIRPHQENRLDIRLDSLRLGVRMPLFFVHFDKGSARLRPEAYPQLDEFARFLSLHPSLRIELAGHTDGTSRAETEIQLSRDRALAVRDYLVRKGFPKEHFHIVGYGKARPIADNETPEGQQKNRRVEFRILGF
jgi:hypothetical protein